MILSKSARYALVAAIEMAAAVEEHPVTVTQVARSGGIPPAVLAKVFQQLVRAGIAVGSRGAGGGYRLAKRPSEVSVLDVIRVFEPVPRAARRGRAAPRVDTRLERLFAEVDEIVRSTYASVTLETLSRVGKAQNVAVRRIF